MMNFVPPPIARRLAERRHEFVSRAVLNTPPIVPADDGLILFSMIGTKVLLPYLVAVKSLHRALGRGRVAILDDGTLTDRDRALLAHHLGDPEIRPIDAVDTGSCPRGGCWERLLTILDLNANDYVIQLDSDTVTVGDLPEVAGAIAANRSFSLRGDETAALAPAASFARILEPGTHQHVQLACEAVLDRLHIPGLPVPRYFRGCAGFAGFARSTAGRGLTEAFSHEGERLMGARWTEWGTEQIASNFTIANDSDPLLLPYSAYINHWDDEPAMSVRFLQFVGTYRHHAGRYRAATKAAITAL